MKACQWCGDEHDASALCQRAQRGMTRRSFCFLFGAGIAGTIMVPPSTGAFVPISDELVELTQIETRVFIEGMSRKLYRTSRGGSTYHLIATITDNETWTVTDTFTEDAPTITISGL